MLHKKLSELKRYILKRKQPHKQSNAFYVVVKSVELMGM
ncbi:hypothetical protein ABIC84_000648 [Mucilaginibacter sp. 3215]